MISVIIPAYNAADYIGRAIESVLAQTHRPDEIIIVDDGSTDETADVIKRYGAAVRYIWQKNAGPSAARNAGIRAARGEWVAFLDADDEWLPERLQLQLALLNRNRDLVWAAANFYRCVCWENRRVVCVEPQAAEALLAGKEYHDNYFAAYTRQANGWTGTMIVRRDVFEQTGLFYEGLDMGEDLDMWWRIAYRWPQIGYISEPVAVYHLGVPASLMRRHRQDSEAICRLIEKHLKLAAEQNQLEQFKPAAVHMLKWWMRNSLFDKRVYDLAEMVRRFDELLPGRFRMVLRIVSAFPRTTMFCCRTISRMIAFFNLRPHIIRGADWS
jgi:glycosyltransferase involved in cell wall biosynthesis